MDEQQFNDPLEGDDLFGSLFDGESPAAAPAEDSAVGGTETADSPAQQLDLPERLQALMEEMRREVFSLASDLRGEVSEISARLARVENDRLPALPAVEEEEAADTPEEQAAEGAETDQQLAEITERHTKLAAEAQELAAEARAAADNVRALIAAHEEALQAAEQARQLTVTLPSAVSLVGEAERLVEERQQALKEAEAAAAGAYERADAVEAALRAVEAELTAVGVAAEKTADGTVGTETEAEETEEAPDPFAELATAPAAPAAPAATEETNEAPDPFAELDDATSDAAPEAESAPATESAPEDPFAVLSTAEADDPFAILDTPAQAPVEPTPATDEAAPAADDPFAVLGSAEADDPFAVLGSAEADDPFAVLGSAEADDPFAVLDTPAPTPDEPTPAADEAAPAADDPFAVLGSAEADDPFAVLGSAEADDPFAVLDTPAPAPVEPAATDDAAPVADDPFAVLDTPAPAPVEPAATDDAAPVADDPFAVLDTPTPAPAATDDAAPVADDPFAVLDTPTPAPAATDDAAPVADDPFAILDTPTPAPVEPAPAADDPFAVLNKPEDDPFAVLAPQPVEETPAEDNPFAPPAAAEASAPAESEQTSDFGYVPSWEEIEDETSNRAIVADIFDNDDSDTAPAAPVAPTQFVDSSQIPEPVDILWAAGSVDPEKNADRKQLEQVQEIRKQAQVDTKKGGRRSKKGAPVFEPLSWETIKPGNPLITVVFSPSGGVGKSSNAMNLAVYMAGSAGAQAYEAEKRGVKNVRVPRVLVLDGDIVHGSLALRLTGRLNPSIHELLLYMDARSSQGFQGRDRWPSSYDNPPAGEREMRYFTMNHQDLPNLNLLAAPDDPDKFFDLRPEDYHEVLQILGQFYDAIIIDSGTEIVMPSTRSWLQHGHAVFMITAPEVDRIHNARKTTRIITSHRPDPMDVSENPKPLPPLVSRDKLAVVLTKADADSGLGLAEEVLEDGFEIIDERNRFYIKDYYREMLRANNMGEFFVLQNPEYAKEIGRMAKFAFSRYQPGA